MQDGALDVGSTGVSSPFRWALFGTLAPKIITPVTTLTLPIFLEPSAFGYVAASASVLTAAQMIAGLGSGAAVVQTQGDVSKTASFTFWTGLSASLLILTVVCIASPLIERAFGFMGLSQIIRTSSIALPLHAIGAVPLALLQRRMDFVKLFWIGTAAQIAGSALALVLVLSGFGVWALVLGPLTAVMLQATVAFAISGWRPIAPWRIRLVPGVLSFSLWMAISNAVSWSFLQADNAIIGLILGAEALGIYSLGFTLATLVPGILAAPVCTVAFPQFARLHAQGPTAVAEHLLRLQRALGVWIVPASVGVALISPVVIPALYGTRWPGLSLVVVTLSLALGPSNIWSVTAQAFRGAGVPQAWLKAAVPALVVMISSLLLVTSSGLGWAVLARAIAEGLYPAASAIMTVLLLRISFREQLRALESTLLPVLAMAIVVLGVASLGLASGAVSGLVLAGFMVASGVAAYAFLLRWLSPGVAMEALGLVGQWPLN